MSTTKRDLVIKIANKTGVSQQTVYQVVQNLLDCVTESLVHGENVELRNFGVFAMRERKPRIGRNPARPEKVVPIPARKVVKFKAGKVMKQSILEGRAIPMDEDVDLTNKE